MSLDVRGQLMAELTAARDRHIQRAEEDRQEAEQIEGRARILWQNAEDHATMATAYDAAITRALVPLPKVESA